jgi:hypothetical protein
VVLVEGVPASVPAGALAVLPAVLPLVAGKFGSVVPVCWSTC